MKYGKQAFILSVIIIFCYSGTFMIQDKQIDDLNKRLIVLEKDPSCAWARSTIDSTNYKRESKK